MRMLSLILLLGLWFTDVRYFFIYMLNSLDVVILATLFILAWKYYH